MFLSSLLYFTRKLFYKFTIFAIPFNFYSGLKFYSPFFIFPTVHVIHENIETENYVVCTWVIIAIVTYVGPTRQLIDLSRDLPRAKCLPHIARYWDTIISTHHNTSYYNRTHKHSAIALLVSISQSLTCQPCYNCGVETKIRIRTCPSPRVCFPSTAYQRENIVLVWSD